MIVICDLCGNKFKKKPREIKRANHHYCSLKCYNKARHMQHITNKKARYKRQELQREKRIKNNGIIDKDITLEKLYIRDNGRCYICNNKCNYDDYKLTNEGYFITGKSYPSIDHIKPLSKYGTHTWNNVKLACFECNIKKNNKLQS